MSSFLTQQMLDQLTFRWEAWASEATTYSQKIVRSRLYLLFLLFRYGGLRLGEALELNAKAAIDSAGMVRITGPGARDVLLPINCMRHVRRILSLPEAEDMGAAFLHFDQGFVRRKFYAVAEPLGLDSALVGPRALRYARGLELLKLHVPFSVVQNTLDLHKTSQTAAFLAYGGGEAARLLRGSVRTDMGGDCNTFLGTITGIQSGLRSVRVEITTFSDVTILALCSHQDFSRLDFRLHQVVTAKVAPEHVIPSAEKHADLFHNCLPGTPDSLHQEQLEAFFCAMLPDGTKLCSILESDLQTVPKLTQRKKVWMHFPARSVILDPD